MPRYRLLALDIDGTLLDERGELRDSTRSAVQRAAAAGINVVLCSGRSYLQAKPWADALGLSEPMVIVGGAMSRHSTTREVWHAERFAPDVAARLIELIRAERMAAITTIDRDDVGALPAAPRSEYVILRGDPPDALDEERMSRRPDVFHFTDSPADLDLARSLRITVSGTPAHFVRMQAALERELAGRVRQHVIAAPDCRYPLMEIYPPHVHKWAGICKVAQRLGVSADQVAAVGDDNNDYEMVSHAGLGVAMGNAVDRLKAAADVVAERHSDDGLAKFIAGHLLTA